MASQAPAYSDSFAEFWEAMAQDNLRKTLVSMAVANVTSKQGIDKVHKVYYEELAATSYIPGNDITVLDVTSTDDSISIDTVKTVPFYLDDTYEVSDYYDTMSEMTSSASYQIRDTIDQAVFANVDSGIEFDDGDLGGTDGSAIIASTGNVVSFFANARKTLGENNVEEEGGFIAVINHAFAAIISQVATTQGFNFADAALNNGKIGNYMGFDLFVTNNLTTETYGGKANTANMYVGKRGQIELIMQQTPRIKVVEREKLLGKNVFFWTKYGTGVWTRNKSRFLDCKVFAS